MRDAQAGDQAEGTPFPDHLGPEMYCRCDLFILTATVSMSAARIPCQTLSGWCEQLTLEQRGVGVPTPLTVKTHA